MTRNVPDACSGRIVDANVARRRLEVGVEPGPHRRWLAEVGAGLGAEKLAALAARHGGQSGQEPPLLVFDANPYRVC